MRYATAYPSVACQARSRRIGRCARCHAPVLSDEEHYADGDAVVHSACLTQPIGPAAGHPDPVSTSTAQLSAPTRRMRRSPPPQPLARAFAAGRPA